MSSEPEDFKPLLRLLALKKHEQPPPGYFDRLPREIKSRLREEKTMSHDWWEELGREAGWMQRMWSTLAQKPALAGAFGAIICTVVISGILYSQKVEPSQIVSVPSVDSTAAELLHAATNSLALTQPARPVENSSTNPILNTPS